MTKRVGYSKTYTTTAWGSNPAGVRDDIYNTLKTYAVDAGFTVAEGLVGGANYFTFSPPAFDIESDTPKYFIRKPLTNVAQVEVGAYSGDFLTAYTPPTVVLGGGAGLTQHQNFYWNYTQYGSNLEIPFTFFFNGVDVGWSTLLYGMGGFLHFSGIQSPHGDKFWELGDAILLGAGYRGATNIYSGMDGANYRVYIESTKNSWSGIDRYTEIIFRPDNSLSIRTANYAQSYDDISGFVIGGVLKGGFAMSPHTELNFTTSNNGVTWTLAAEPINFKASETFGVTSISANTTFRACFDATVGEFFIHWIYNTTKQWICFAPFTRDPLDQSVTQVCRYGYVYSYYDPSIVIVPWLRTRTGGVLNGRVYENAVYGVLRLHSALGGYPTSSTSTVDYGISKAVSPALPIPSFYEAPMFIANSFGDVCISTNMNIAGLLFTDFEVYKSCLMAFYSQNYAAILVPIPSAGLTALASL